MVVIWDHTCCNLQLAVSVGFMIIQGTILHTNQRPQTARAWPTVESLKQVIKHTSVENMLVLNNHDETKPVGKVIKFMLDSTGKGLIAVMKLTKEGQDVARHAKCLSPKFFVTKAVWPSTVPKVEILEVSLVKSPGLNFTFHSEVVHTMPEGNLITASAATTTPRAGAGTGAGLSPETRLALSKASILTMETVWTTSSMNNRWQPTQGALRYRVVLFLTGEG